MSTETEYPAEKLPTRKGAGLKPGQYRDERGIIRGPIRQPASPVEPRTDNEPGIPPMLSLYRWVMEQPKNRDTTEPQKNTRAAKESNPAKFLDRLDALESEWAANQKALNSNANDDQSNDSAPFEELEVAWGKILEFEKSKDEFFEWKRDQESTTD